MTEPGSHGGLAPSAWVQRWSHLVRPQGTVLDIACGQGRHLQWFAQRGHHVLGIDRDPDALAIASAWGPTLSADIENHPWPLLQADGPRQFDAVVVTNYLWRALFPVILQSLAPGAVLIYETFSQGNATVGKPSRADFLLQSGELLKVFPNLQVIAFEEGFLDHPSRFVQRLTAVQPDPEKPGSDPARYPLQTS